MIRERIVGPETAGPCSGLLIYEVEAIEQMITTSADLVERFGVVSSRFHLMWCSRNVHNDIISETDVAFCNLIHN